MSLTRTVTSAAALAALALVCGPVLERTGDGSAAAAAAAISAGSPSATGAAAQRPAPVLWNGSLPIRPSRFANAPAGNLAARLAGIMAGLPVVEAVPVGPPGEVGALGIPLMVLRAYHLAADRVDLEQPSCKLPWWLLAGIGHTESGHAESGRLTADGTTRGKILGPRLNGGIPGDAVITDTDHGALDGDTVYDRAVGPMQFIPSTWVHWGADGNADGKSDPSNIFDATLAAADYLCADGRDLSTQAGLEAAVLSYNHSAPYLATVLAWGEAYRDGVAAVPDSPLPVVSDVTKVRPPKSSQPPARTPAPVTSAASPSQSAPASPSASASGTASTSTSPSASGSTSGSASGSSSGSSSPSASASPSCTSASPSPTDSSSDPVQAATQSRTGSSAGTTRSGLSSAATADGSPVATPGRSSGSSTGSSGSRSQSATAQSAQSAYTQSAAGQSGSATDPSASATPTDSSSASASPSSCAP